MFCRVSSTLSPRNGDTPDSMTYASTPTDQMSVCGKAGSSLNTSGADKNNSFDFTRHTLLWMNYEF